MSLLEALKFVRGAVAKKDYQPALTHFHISEGRVTGYDGTVALSSPIDLDIEAMPKALDFVKAIERCEDETTIHITPGGKLSLRSGKFRALIPCHDDSEILSGVVPEGDPVALTGQFLPALSTISPFIGNDASRPWAMGILLDGGYAYATNNIILVQYWIGEATPTINIPVQAVNELNRIGVEPEDVWLGENNITFFFPGDRWMRCQLLNTEWPNVNGMLDKAFENVVEMKPLPEGLFDVVDKLKPFIEDEGHLFFRGTSVQTSPVEDEGAGYELEVPEAGAFHNKHLMLLKGVVAQIDFSVHPQPCPFFGENLRGVILGMREAV